MSVQMLVGTPTYNKAPSPVPTPHPKLYPVTLTVLNDQQVWISVPQPDKLHLVVRLQPKHFAAWYKPEDPQDYGRMIMQALATGQAGKVGISNYVAHSHIYTRVQVSLGQAEQPVFFMLSRTSGDATGPHTLTIQMNPRLLTEEGVCEFLDRLHQVTSNRLLVGAMLADARVSRLDVAVDIVGLEIADVLVRLKGERCRCHRSGSTGHLETVEIWPKGTKSAKTTNRAVMVYDKRAERIAAGKSPPHGFAQVTRLEVTKTRFSNAQMMLANLGGMSNPLDRVFVSSVRHPAVPQSWSFLQYIDARRVAGAARAAANLSISSSVAAEFEAVYLKHGSDLMNCAGLWKLWGDGLVATGTHLLIEAAVKKSHGVPLPDLDWAC